MSRARGTSRSRRIVEFVDTSILLEILDVPGKAEQPAAFRAELLRRVETGRLLILPTAAVIETGNHIHHVADGGERRRCGSAFAKLLELSVLGEAPWVLHDATWDAGLLDRIRTGCSTGADLAEHATRGKDNGLGTGDLSILAERDVYRQHRVDPRSVDVRVWSADRLLTSYSAV